MKKISLVALSLVVGLLSFAQNVNELRYCGQVGRTMQFHQHHPECGHDVRVAESELEELTRTYSEDERGGGQTIYQIPVVFHIIHNDGPENISDAQVYDAMFILNRDFRKQNADTIAIVSAFEDIAADVGIEFVLASKDPFGNCHPGIVRVQSPLTTEGGSEMKALSMWPRNRYLNVWVCADAGDGTAGYTFLPSTVSGNWGSENDGIVLRHDYTGSIGTGNLFRSRTLTHEVGHWINLSHPWGPTNSPGEQSNCDFDDGVDDTPNTIGWTSCDLDGASCGSAIDNVQNYMEYSYCSRMFTEGQRSRMRAALTSPIAQRNNLITTNNLILTGVIDPELCFCDFRLIANTACVGQPITFNDLSYHGIELWSWDFGDGNTLEGSDPNIHKNPVYTYQEPGTYTVTLTVANGSNTLTVTKENIITIFDYAQESAPLEEGFESTWPNDAWAIYNHNNDLTYEITPSAAFTGTKSLKLRNFSNTEPGRIDELLSATYDMSGMDTVWLSYRWAYANKTSGVTEDRLRIQVSGDCGATWSTRRTRMGTNTLPTANAINSQFTPTSTSQWGGETIIMSDEDWMNDGFRVRFEFTGQGGNNFYLDDINITASDTITVIPTNIREIKPTFVYSVFPNPTKDQTNIRYYALQSEFISAKMYNSLGQLVTVIAEEMVPAGETMWVVNKQPAGIYTIVLEKAGYRQVEKVLFE
jgi:PKD repeat protein